MNRNKDDRSAAPVKETAQLTTSTDPRRNQQQTNTLPAHKDYSKLSFDELYQVCRQLGAFD